MNVRYDFSYPLWDDLITEVIRYKSFFSKKSRRQRKIDNIELLNGSLSHDWQSASEISKKVGVSFHQSVKLLQISAGRLDTVECKRTEWVDYKKRHRVTHLYRRRIVPVFLTMGIFSQAIPVMHGIARVHICKDE